MKKHNNNQIIIECKGVEISQSTFHVIAGPCTISSYENLYATALKLKELGIGILRGGAYKMRTSYNSFRGLGESGIECLYRVGKELDMLTVSEVTDPQHIEMMSQKIDILLVGTRNMHNYPLLERLGKIGNPIILKRGMGSTIQEWISAAEYIEKNGNSNIILCERGIRSFESMTRYTFDPAAIPLAQKLTPYPIFADPSHSSGDRDLILPISWAATAAGANGLIIETEIDPDQAVCDAQQTIDIETLEKILKPLSLINKLWE